MRLKVNEIFYSIQGESTYSGRPCAFVRLSGCNLRCRYCDTTYAYHRGTAMTIADVIARLTGYGCALVSVTGGEPLLQDHAPELVRRLLEKDKTVLVETNGSLDISVLDPRCTRIVDVKCPGSGESGGSDPQNLERLTTNDQIKFVLTDRGDYDFAKSIIAGQKERLKPDQILLSPAHGHLSPDQLARWILDDRLAVRLNLQLHKFIWPHESKGV